MIKDTWRNSLLMTGSSIRDAIECLDRSAVRVVLINNTAGKFFGTVSDGDIRRGLLRGLQLSDSVSLIVNQHPIVAKKNSKIADIQMTMLNNNIQQIPIIDDDGLVIGLHLWNHMSLDIRDNLFVIMAGGLGRRLRPFTEECPKPLLAVDGKPMLQHIIERAKSQGFMNFIISINYLGKMIEDYFGDGKSLGVKISYIKEEEPLGTAGAIPYIQDNLEIKLPIIVTNGDVITNIDYRGLLDFHIQHKASGTMSVKNYEWQHPYGVVNVEGLSIKGIAEKPIYSSFVNAGVYVLSEKILKFIKRGAYCDMPSLFDAMIEGNEVVVAYPIHEDWLDVGKPADLIFANKNIKD